MTPGASVVFGNCKPHVKRSYRMRDPRRSLKPLRLPADDLLCGAAAACIHRAAPRNFSRRLPLEPRGVTVSLVGAHLRGRAARLASPPPPQPRARSRTNQPDVAAPLYSSITQFTGVPLALAAPARKTTRSRRYRPGAPCTNAKTYEGEPSLLCPHVTNHIISRGRPATRRRPCTQS